ncbi:HAD family hydrolase [Streptomyces sp. bgisy153]|uniref:HAD family hydrolase n=1 Tax=Streptomyces sp. bgisy153 TaxID=3413793 RepID=UPI003D730AEC
MAVRKVALFDLDSTLTDHAAAFRSWAEEFSAVTGIPVPWLVEAEVRHAGLRHAFFADVKATWDIPQSIARMHADYRRRSAELVPRRPDVCTAVQALTEDGWALGVVTNGAPDSQRLKLEVSGLAVHFTSVIISGEFGVRKPDKALFELALDELAAGPRTWSAMVGDCLATDIAGGQQAGLNTVWVSPSRRRRPRDPIPTHTVATVTDAAQWLLSSARSDGRELVFAG